MQMERHVEVAIINGSLPIQFESPHGLAWAGRSVRVHNRDWVDEPIVTAARVRRIARHLDIAGFRIAGKRRCDVDSVIRSGCTREADDERAGECTSRHHGEHVLVGERALVLNVGYDEFRAPEWRIGRRSVVRITWLNSVVRVEAELHRPYRRTVGVELPISILDVVVAVGGQEGGNGVHVVEVGPEAVAPDVVGNSVGVKVGDVGGECKGRDVTGKREAGK